MTAPRYFNQVRTIKDGNVIVDWHDGCHGHAEMLLAIECKDRVSALRDGTLVPANIIEFIGSAQAMERRESGLFDEFRIVKRTYTEEVVESDEAISSE